MLLFCCCCAFVVLSLSHSFIHFTIASSRVVFSTFYIILISFHFCYAGCDNIEIMLLMCIILASHLFSWMRFSFILFLHMLFVAASFFLSRPQSNLTRFTFFFSSICSSSICLPCHICNISNCFVLLTVPPFAYIHSFYLENINFVC